VTRYEWVLARKAEDFPVTAACGVAEVSIQAFNDWRRRREGDPTPAELEQAALVEAMWEVHDEFDGVYGSPRMTVELNNQGWVVNHKRVERLMALHGIVGVHKPAKVRTTIPAEEHPPLPDLIGRRFKPGPADAAWVGDITYVPTGEGWLDLATVILEMAAAARGAVTAGIIFHPLNLGNTCQVTTSDWSVALECASRSAGPGCAGTTPWPSRSSAPSNESWSRDTGSAHEPTPARRSSFGSINTAPASCTPASASVHPSTGRTPPPPGLTRPHKPSDRQTGGSSTTPHERLKESPSRPAGARSSPRNPKGSRVRQCSPASNSVPDSHEPSNPIRSRSLIAVNRASPERAVRRR